MDKFLQMIEILGIEVLAQIWPRHVAAAWNKFREEIRKSVTVGW